MSVLTIIAYTLGILFGSTIIGILTGQLLRYRRKQYEEDYEKFYHKD